MRQRHVDDRREWTGQIAVPVLVKGLRDLGRDASCGQDVEVGELQHRVRAEIGIADVASADDRRLNVGDQRLVVRGAVETLELREIAQRLEAAIGVGVE
ncbi:MAG: hypothetical protein MUC77_17690 [Chromatiaceae bacterium]|nr:hypothetical protein [Chromatiaceae bacterium]